ncbi:alpha-N-acetylgalactosamine-specific lectin-like [Uranotaenia lowii]|uniref:alpha-N-acetylgalactosamine-specific lectin-like n=1 Tax=Uranotaenia lowii TaxID=190385 RepID=UPI0024789E7F|nr:alpha-N-acetylgalactosamine-specific lectin-like [Uranotaenia lowii]
MSLVFLICSLIVSVTAIVTPISQRMVKQECSEDTPIVVPNFKANWFKAVEYCHYLGRNLMGVASAEKQDTITTVLEETDKFSDSSFWIGASDLAEVGNFHWHSTGTRVTWYNWNEMLELPKANDNRKDDRCVVLNHHQQGAFKWIINNCWDEYYFACERA